LPFTRLFRHHPPTPCSFRFRSPISWRSPPRKRHSHRTASLTNGIAPTPARPRPLSEGAGAGEASG
jgi:hypothetical protein